jgi:hypothetical protein
MHLVDAQPSRESARGLEREFFQPRGDARGDRGGDRWERGRGEGAGGRFAGRLEMGRDNMRFEPYSGGGRDGRMRMDDREFRRRGGGGGGWGRRGGRGGGGGGGGKREPRQTPEDLDKAMDNYWNSVRCALWISVLARDVMLSMRCKFVPEGQACQAPLGSMCGVCAKLARN